VPHLGDSVTSAAIQSWEKKPGDAVQVDDVVVVLETDKICVDIRSEYAGRLGRQLPQLPPNSEVRPQDLLFTIELPTAPFEHKAAAGAGSSSSGASQQQAKQLYQKVQPARRLIAPL
jgi:2-oxoglutarate dehydrogenase E2 component (dihydrolipoamide succinyltransferase)